jgi:hypothetical protein
MNIVAAQGDTKIFLQCMRVFENRVLGEYLDLRGMKLQEGEENCIMRSSIICTLHQILCDQIKED